MALTIDTDLITADGGIVGPQPESFGDLRTQVLDYLDRPELAPQFRVWVRLFQNKVNRLLRTAGGEKQATLAIDPAGAGAPLPADYQAWRSVQYQPGGCGWALDYATPDVIADRYPTPCPGLPWAFTIQGTTLFTAPIGGPVLLTYYRGVPLFIDGVLNDWLLLAHFDLYLYGVLTEAELHLKHDDRAQMWEGRAANALADLMGADRDARWGRARVMMAGPTP